MSALPTRPPRPLPFLITGAGSLFAVGHLLAIGLLALAAESGPWLMSNGVPSTSLGPEFATRVSANYTVPYYFQRLRMTHNYHFESNKPIALGIYFEVKLKDETGTVVRTLKFPDDKANFWVRHRQNILALGLGNDQQLPRRGTEVIPAKGEKMPTAQIWDKSDIENWRLKEVEEHLLPRDQPFERPSEEAKKLTQAYMRFLCREHKAASAELIRHHRQAIPPMVLLMGPPPAEAFSEAKSHFGDYRREE
ncbi:MAG: hypothetical protein EXR98_23595 [Gemmataceae bacterium]|nr:hypothetical protein [Gemmataceae bacterium]